MNYPSDPLLIKELERALTRSAKLDFIFRNDKVRIVTPVGVLWKPKLGVEGYGWSFLPKEETTPDGKPNYMKTFSKKREAVAYVSDLLIAGGHV